MASSTFYDLKQIRNDLSDFLVNDLGYVPLLSELNSFPIDPDADTVENCRRRVENDADILVLVIGGRYGSVDHGSSKSVTNLEYLAARLKGVPVFVFIQKSVLALLPVWKMDPGTDFSAVVDDVRLFKFIEEIRSSDKVWTFEFELAKDIMNTLRIQFAYLMNEGLLWTRKLQDSKVFDTTNLSGDSIRIAIERPKGWEYKLFAHSWIDQVGSFGDLHYEYSLGITVGAMEYRPIAGFREWMLTKLEEILRIGQVLDKLINEVAVDAFGTPGTSGDPNKILFVTREIASVYREAIEWALRIRRTRLDKELEPARMEMIHFTSDVIEKVRTGGAIILKEIEDVFSSTESDKSRTINLTLHLGFSGFC